MSSLFIIIQIFYKASYKALTASAGSSNTPPTATTNTSDSSTSKISPISRAQQQSLDGLSAVRYKGVIKLVEGYEPPLSCSEHMLQDLPNVLSLKDILGLVEDCIQVAESCLQHLSAGVPRLSLDQALAVAAYSYDFGFSNASDNLFFVLNEVLRERNPQKMKYLQPFLAYLMSGLTKLPPESITVFRGIPFSAMDLIKQHYVQGVDVHWSAFTSTTTNLEKAQKFTQGKGGIIMRIDVLTGRNIKHYSAIPSEDEILLSPNCRLVVVKAVHLESDGYYYVDMIERNEGKSFIF